MLLRFSFPGPLRLGLLSSLLFLALSPANACVLAGYDSGVCKAAQDIQDDMPFCADVVRYTACVPRYVPWYGNLTVRKKDQWAKDSFDAFIDERERIEAGKFSPTDQYSYNYVSGLLTKRFTGIQSDDCVEAFRNFLCWMNFPRCDGAGNSLLLCRSVCENFFRACKYPKVFWRCYEPAYHGGEYPEGTQGDQLYDKDNQAEFRRAPFPGLPFRDNEFQSLGLNADEDEPIVVCTPSIRNGEGDPAAETATGLWRRLRTGAGLLLALLAFAASWLLAVGGML